MQEVARGQPNGLAAFRQWRGRCREPGRHNGLPCARGPLGWRFRWQSAHRVLPALIRLSQERALAILRRSVRSTDFVGLPRTSLVSTPRRRKRNGARMRSASSRMRWGPIEKQAAHVLRSSRMDTEPGLMSTRRIRRSRGAARHYHHYYRNTARLKSDAPRRALASSECGSTRPRRSWHPHAVG